MSRREVWQAFCEYCRQPKNRWDAFDYTRGFIAVFSLLIGITWLAVVLTDAN